MHKLIMKIRRNNSLKCNNSTLHIIVLSILNKPEVAKVQLKGNIASTLELQSSNESSVRYVELPYSLKEQPKNSLHIVKGLFCCTC